MKRSNHQFRPNPLEVFETRIVPTVTAIPGLAGNLYGTPFVPPGDVGPIAKPAGYASSGPSISGNSISYTATSTQGGYVTFAVYTAPGGGSANAPSQAGTTSGSENLASQKRVYRDTEWVAAGTSYTFTVDVSTLKLTGREQLQCDLFSADDCYGYAPDKLDLSVLNNHLFDGELFLYADGADDVTHGKK